MEVFLPHDLRIPTVNPVGLLYSTGNATLGYLKQRDAGVSLRPPETRYYGSGFTTSTTLAQLASSEVFQVITIFRIYSWEVLARCGPPPVPVDPRGPPPAPPVVPPGWGDAEWNWPPPSSAHIDFSMTPSQNPTHPYIC
jgi:hypothetical protein